MKGACTTAAVRASCRIGVERLGRGFANTRYQPTPGLAAGDVPKLTLKWAFGFPMGNSSYGQPAVVGGRVFVGGDTGFVYSLDATRLRVLVVPRDAGVRTAPTVGAGSGPIASSLYFGDIRANVYAVNAETGALVWRRALDAHPVARVTGAPALADGKLFVPLSSLEESGAGNPSYPCCTFRGGVAAFDAQSGRRSGSRTRSRASRSRRKLTSKGTQLWGPAGAGVWSSPTVDLERRAVYVATGNGYTEPADEGSDAVIAFDIDSGRRLWARQALPGDHYVRDCPGDYRPLPKDNKSETCPDDLGPDYDFGNSPILRRTPAGKTVIVIGQKSGHAWEIDPGEQGHGAVEPSARARLREWRRRDDVGLGRHPRTATFHSIAPTSGWDWRPSISRAGKSPGEPRRPTAAARR